MDIKMRPRFRAKVETPPDEVMAQFEVALDCETCFVHGNLFEHQVELKPRADERHFWSPFLNLVVVPAEGGTELRGKFGPSVNVWTMFMAGYGVSAFTAFGAFFLGTSQLTLGQRPTGLYIVAAAFAFAVLVYLLGRLGRRLGRDQMITIRKFVDEVIGPHD